MKRALLLAILLMLSSIMVFAQEDEMEAADMSLTYVFSQYFAEGGALFQDGDGYYLELLGIEEDMTFIRTTPNFSAGATPASVIYLGFAEIENSTIEEVILDLGDEQYVLSLDFEESDEDFVLFAVNAVSEYDEDGELVELEMETIEFDEGTIYFYVADQLATDLDALDLGVRCRSCGR